MGVSSSRDTAGNLPSNSGFTPLTPLRRPGSIRKLKSDDHSEPLQSKCDVTYDSAVVKGNDKSGIDESEKDSVDKRLDGSDHEALQTELSVETPILQNISIDMSMASSVDEKQINSKAVDQSPSNQAHAVSPKCVYGAAYPPEMAEAMMKQLKGNNSHFGSSIISFASIRLGSAIAGDSPVESAGTDSARIKTVDNAATRNKAKYEKVLEETTVNLNELQSLCWAGCPPDHRANTWRLLLRYMPANSDRREAKMTRLRGEYTDAVAKYFDRYDASSASCYDRTMYNQIAVDLPRTNPSMGLFQQPSVQACLHRILYVWAIRHPGTGYVQGINDLVTPFFFVFLLEQSGATDTDVAEGRVMESELGVSKAQLDIVEADSYHCLTNLLDSAQDNYVLDSKGIQEKVFMLKRIIARLDDKLFTHFENMEVEFLQFAFRWFNCLLMREFSLACTLRLWDTYVAERSFAVFHVYVCAAVLLAFSRQLQEMDFQQIITFLQRMPTLEWDEERVGVIVAQAYSWCQQWSSSHL